MQVCTGTTGHAEAVKFEYDPEKLNYGDMVSGQLPYLAVDGHLFDIVLVLMASFSIRYANVCFRFWALAAFSVMSHEKEASLSSDARLDQRYAKALGHLSLCDANIALVLT